MYRLGQKQSRRKSRISIKGAFAVVVGALALAVGTSAMPALADTVAVNLACNEGTNLNLALDLTSLQELENAVQAMALYPAGITCGVTQLPGPTALGLGHPAYADSAHDFAVGAEQVTGPPDGCIGDITINVSAHKEAGAANNTATGHVRLSSSTCGDETVEVNCLNVTGNMADISGTVTEATGYFASTPAGATGGTQNLSIEDNPSPTTDPVGTAQLAGDCTRVGYNRIVESGNFVVRSGS